MRICKYHDDVNCPMTRINPVVGRGTTPCSIMLIGEAPGKTEDKVNKPFVGKAGIELEHLYLSRCAQISRDNIYITNVVKCRTNDKDRDPTLAEIEACGHVLTDEIRKVRPRFIGTVGRIATRFMLGDAVTMEKVHGFGYMCTVPSVGEMIRIMPLYHPAYGLHNTTMIRHIMGDFTAFGRMVRGNGSVMWKERSKGE